CGYAGVEQSSAGGVSVIAADGAVGQRQIAIVVDACAVAAEVVVADRVCAADRQSDERSRDASANIEYRLREAVNITTDADSHAAGRPKDPRLADGVGQFEPVAAAEGDRSGRGEDGWIEGDIVGGLKEIGAGDRLTQRGKVGVRNTREVGGGV